MKKIIFILTLTFLLIVLSNSPAQCAPELTVEGETLLATVSGNVGVGTTSPSRLFDVESSSSSALAEFRTTATQTNAYALVDILAEQGTDTRAALRVKNDNSGWTVGMDDDNSFKISHSFGSDFTSTLLSVSGYAGGTGTVTIDSKLRAGIYEDLTKPTDYYLDLDGISWMTRLNIGPDIHNQVGPGVDKAILHVGGGSDQNASIYGGTIISNTRAIYGYSDASTGSESFGVAGQTASTTNYVAGVYGEAVGATGATCGVRGVTRSNSNFAAGIYGEATGASAETYGVYGIVSSPNGYSGHFSGGRGIRVEGAVYATQRATITDHTGHLSAGDIAEDIRADGCEPGDVVVIDSDNDRSVVKSNKPYLSNIAGIISEHPVFHIGNREGEKPLALAGQIKCNVTTENGPIKRGDILVTSSKPGYAMKGDLSKVNVGMIVGRALEPLDSGEGKVLVLVE